MTVGFGTSLVLLVAAAHVLAGAPAEGKCTAAKLQAFGKLVDARAKCQADARKRGDAVDATCVAKANAKLEDQFAKAEKDTTCAGDAAERVGAAAACVASFDDAITGDPSCASAKLKAAGKKTAGKRQCAKKNLLKGAAIEPCFAKVEAKFAKAVTKAESKHACTGTVAGLEAIVDTCVRDLPPSTPCTGGDGYPLCDGSCPDGLACRPDEVFVNGTSVDRGCSCVDVAGGPLCGGTTCGADMHCADPTYVCERWTSDVGCDHSICQPALTTPTTLPSTPDNNIFCDGGEFPSCGGTCPAGLRCQTIQGFFQGETVFTACLCVDPAAPRCDAPNSCDIAYLPFSHCADPSLTCLVTLEGIEGSEIPLCLDARCGPAQPTTTSSTLVATTSSTSTSTSSTSTTESTTTTSSSTTTSTSSTTTSTLPCVSTPATSGNLQDLGNCTTLDSGTGLQWEQKQNVPGPHDVNNRYVWAGCCADDCQTMCQPNAAAKATCLAMSEVSTEGCNDQCPGGEGCYVERGGLAITTVFDWINQINAENFAGHDDWRLPSDAGQNPTGARELESILQHPCTGTPCIDPLFGPTIGTGYWSRTSNSSRDVEAWFVNFFDGVVSNSLKREPFYVRAVR